MSPWHLFIALLLLCAVFEIADWMVNRWGPM